MREIKWENRALAELGSVSRGKSKHRPRNDKKLYGGDYPFIQTADVKNAIFYINEFSQTYNEVGLKQSKLWEKDTLCITIAANIAETALLSFPACFPDSIVGFIPFENISDVRYIKYTLDNYKTEFQKRSKGATQDNLSVSKINSLKLLIPDYDYQVKVADVISKYDLLIENNQKRIVLLEEIAQRLYTEWFVKYKFPGHDKVRLVDSGTELGSIPHDWSVKKLKDIAILTMGQSPESKYYNEVNEGIAFHQGVKDYGHFFPKDRVYSTEGNRFAEKYDLLFSVRAPVGKLNISLSKIIIGRGLASIRGNMNNHWFLVIAFYNRFSEKDMLGNGAIYKSINKAELENLKFIYPTKSLLNESNRRIENIFLQIENLSKRNTLLTYIRNLLIESLITGRKMLKYDN